MTTNHRDFTVIVRIKGKSGITMTSLDFKPTLILHNTLHVVKCLTGSLTMSLLYGYMQRFRTVNYFY